MHEGPDDDFIDRELEFIRHPCEGTLTKALQDATDEQHRRFLDDAVRELLLAERMDLDTMRLLVENGASPHLEKYYGEEAIHWILKDNCDYSKVVWVFNVMHSRKEYSAAMGWAKVALNRIMAVDKRAYSAGAFMLYTMEKEPGYLDIGFERFMRSFRNEFKKRDGFWREFRKFEDYGR